MARTLLRSIGVQPSSRPGVPRAWRDQAQKSVAEQKKTFDNGQQQIKTLENQASESLQRQQLLQEELIKAEAQIELIKDLLLREPGL